MISKKSNQEIITRQVKNYGDAAIINGFLTTEWWRELLQSGRGMAALLFFQYYLRYLIWLFANSTGVVFRLQHGSQTMGLISTISCLLLILLFNWVKVWFVFKPMVLPLMPVYYATRDWTGLHKALLVDMHSTGLIVFAGIYLLLAIVQLVQIFTGYGNEDGGKRGNSWLLALLPIKPSTSHEFVFQAIGEPGIIASVGLLFWNLNDPVFGVFLWISAGCMFAQEVMDWSRQQKNKPVPRRG